MNTLVKHAKSTASAGAGMGGGGGNFLYMA